MERSGALTIVAVLIIAAGLSVVLEGIISIAGVNRLLFLVIADIFIDLGSATLVIFGIIGIILGGLTSYGGYLAFNRTKYNRAKIFGGICGLLSIAFMGLIGLIFIILSKDEFTS